MGIVVRRVIGVIAILIGLVWIGQGVGAIGGSFMSGEAIWAVIGAIVVLFGLALLRGARNRS
jgi:hypothetical protein